MYFNGLIELVASLKTNIPSWHHFWPLYIYNHVWPQSQCFFFFLDFFILFAKWDSLLEKNVIIYYPHAIQA